MKNSRKKNAGVTLLETMIVLAIMALIIGLASPKLMQTFGRAKSQAAEIQMSQLKAALQLYNLDTGQFPNEIDGLSALLQEPAGVSGWNGPYISGVDDTIDPWGRGFIYRFPVENFGFALESYGRDGAIGGTSEDRDLSV